MLRKLRYTITYVPCPMYSHLFFKITLTLRGRKDNIISPFESIKVDELFNEVFDRGLITKDNSKTKLLREDLEELLKEHMAGLCRIPAMCYGAATQTMNESNLEDLEV